VEANVELASGATNHYTVAEFFPSQLEGEFATDPESAASEYADDLNAKAEGQARLDAKIAAWKGPSSGAVRWGRGFHAFYEAAPDDFQIVDHKDAWGYRKNTHYRTEAGAEKAGAKALNEAIAAINQEGA
jgi:hypothetical protein